MSKVITMAAVLTLSATLAIAGPHGDKGGRGGKHGRGDFSARFAQELGLSDAQKEAIQNIRKNNREANKAFFEQSRETFRQFREAKKAGDTARVEQLRPAMEQQRAQLKQFRETERNQILSLLTPEQRTKLDALKAERESRRGERGERRRNRQ